MKKSGVFPFNPGNPRDGDMSILSPQAGGTEKATHDLDTEFGHSGSRPMVWYELSR